jgi:hypothetical protein
VQVQGEMQQKNDRKMAKGFTVHSADLKKIVRLNIRLNNCIITRYASSIGLFSVLALSQMHSGSDCSFVYLRLIIQLMLQNCKLFIFFIFNFHVALLIFLNHIRYSHHLISYHLAYSLFELHYFCGTCFALLT